jgi:hypothetical protein
MYKFLRTISRDASVVTEASTRGESPRPFYCQLPLDCFGFCILGVSGEATRGLVPYGALAQLKNTLILVRLNTLGNIRKIVGTFKK